MRERPCQYDGTGTCDGTTPRLYPCGTRCDKHSPWNAAGRVLPTPDPALTADGLRATWEHQRAQAAAAATLPPDVVEKTHLVGCAQAAIRHRRPPTRDQSAARALQERDQAMAQVEAHTPEAWQDQARKAIWHLATTTSIRAHSQDKPTAEFTTDDVWSVLEAWHVHTIEPRALGPVIMRAVRAGAITDTGKIHKSLRRHGTRMPIYQRSPQS